MASGLMEMLPSHDLVTSVFGSSSNTRKDLQVPISRRRTGSKCSISMMEVLKTFQELLADIEIGKDESSQSFLAGECERGSQKALVYVLKAT